MDKINVHIISHTHWDREWFLPATYTSPWLVPFFDKLFQILKKHKDYKFILDGQVQILEDYLNELPEGERGEKELLLKKYIDEEQLFVGPYWAQIDWQIPGAESLVRNLLLADRYLKQYGKKMKVGWLPDTFGQIGQVPQIHKLSGIEGLFVWRGIEFPEDDVHAEFLWEGPDKTKVVSSYFLASYRNLMGLTTYPEIANPRLENEIEKIRPFLTTSNAFLLNGYDLDNSPEYPMEVVDKGLFPQYNIFQSDPKRYIDSIKDETPSLLILKGEMLSGRYLSVFPGKLATRTYLKIENYMCEYLLSRVVEPIGVFSWFFSGYYPHNKINNLWKELILNEIHDNISGVGVDQIHKRMEKSYGQIISKGKEILKKLVAKILPHVQGGKWLVFNTNPYSIDTYFEKDSKIYKIEKLPPMGFKTLSSLPSYEIEEKEEKIEQFSWENDYYKAEVSPFGTLTIYDKKSAKTYKDLGFFLDEEDMGDEYNFSPGDPDKTVTTKGYKAELILLRKSPISSEIVIKQKINSPQGGEVFVASSLLFDDTPLLRYNIHVENRAKNHRFKMVFPTQIENPRITAHMPFEYVDRPEFIDNSRPIPFKFSRIFIGARECSKDYEFPMGDFVSLSKDGASLSIFPRGLKEYEVHGSDLHITLFRSVGWITKGEIKTRIGDAGPLMYTPGAQCIGEFNLELALYISPHTPEDREHRYWKGVYHNPPIVFEIGKEIEGDTTEFSLFKVEDLDITTLKVAEEGNGIIVRGFNPLKSDVTFSLPFECLERVDLLEKTIWPEKDSVRVAPNEIISLKICKKPDLSDKEEKEFSIVCPSFEWNVYRENEDHLSDEDDIVFLKKTRDRLKGEIERLKESLSEKKGLAYHRGVFEILSRERTYLEVVLSLLLNEEMITKDKEKKKALEDKIKEVGLKLNDARIRRRAYEYVLDYYENANQ